jgi:hypothetical protein
MTSPRRRSDIGARIGSKNAEVSMRNVLLGLGLCITAALAASSPTASAQGCGSGKADCGDGRPTGESTRAYRSIENAGGKCLDVDAPNMRNDGARVQVWSCNGKPQQQWRLVGRAIVNASGKCLDVHAPDMRNPGARVQVWSCNGESQQQWRLEDRRIVNAGGGLCLDVHAPDMHTDGGKVQAWGCTDAPPQHWKLK